LHGNYGIMFVNVLNKCTKHCQRKKGNRIGIKLVRCIFLVLNKCTKYCKKNRHKCTKYCQKKRHKCTKYCKKKRQHDSDAFF